MLMLNDFTLWLSELPIHTAIIGGILGFFVLLFVIRFFIPAIYQNWKLGRYTKKVEGVDEAHLDGLSELFSKDQILDHLWKEFRDTLHEQKDLDASGIYHTTAIRQTVPARCISASRCSSTVRSRPSSSNTCPDLLSCYYDEM